MALALSAYDKAWFALQVRPRSETNIAMILREKGYHEFLPTRSAGSLGGKSQVQPLFPGYVFCRFDSSLPLRILTTPGVIRIVGYGNVPSAIPESEIETIRTLEKSGLSLRPHPYFHKGDRVRICEGPLRGTVGTIVSMQHSNLFVVSVTLLQRSVSVEINPQCVVPLERQEMSA